MTLPNDPNPPENFVTADRIVLNVKRKMTREQAEQITALSKVYSKKSFPDGMLEEAMEALSDKVDNSKTVRLTMIGD